MSSFHHASHHTLFFFQKSLKELFWSSLLRQSALAFVTIFSFVYVYTLAIEWNFFSFVPVTNGQRGLLAVALYVVLLRGLVTFLTLPLSRIAVSVGLTTTIAIANIFMIAKYVAFFFMIQHWIWFFVALTCQAIELSLYWPSYQTLFVSLASVGKFGRDLGSFQMMLKVLHAVLPAVAGVVIVLFGYPIIFLIACGLIVISNIPLLRLKTRAIVGKTSVKGLQVWTRKHAHKRAMIATIGLYLQDAVTELWPLYVLLILGSILHVGLLFSAASMLAVILAYFAGWYSDHTKKPTLFFISGGIVSLTWLGRAVFSVVTGIAILEVIDKLSASFLVPSFDTRLYEQSKHDTPFTFYTYREVVLSFYATLIWIIFFFLFLLFTSAWFVLFIVASVGVLFSLLIGSRRL